MKLLVATRRFQGTRKNDIWEFEREGELVVPRFKLGLGEFADDEDGHARSMYGVLTSARTSTALVKDVPMSDAAMIPQIVGLLMRTFPDVRINYEKQAAELLHRLQLDLLHIPLFSVVECRDLRFNIRKVLTSELVKQR